MKKPITGRMNSEHVEYVIENKQLIIRPFDSISMQSASYDVTLSNVFLIKKLWVWEVSSVENQKNNYFQITLPKNTDESLKNNRLYQGQGLFWSVQRWLFSLKHFFFAGVDKHGYFVRLFPFSLILGMLNEKIELDEYTEAILDGKSTGGRLGLTAHVTAGYADIGYHGNMTTESVNPLLCTIRLYPDSYIGQLRFTRFEDKCKNIYGKTKIGNNYQGDDTPRASVGLKIKRK